MKIDFEFQTNYGRFTDALTLPDDHTLSEAEIELLKQQRVDNWISVMEQMSNIDAPVEVDNGE